MLYLFGSYTFMNSRERRRRISDSQDRAALVATLQAQPGERLRASDLKASTGVPKSRVRGLLSDVGGVTVTREGTTFWYSWAAGPEPTLRSLPGTCEPERSV